MKFLSLYRGSFYLMLFFATATLCVDTTESYFSLALPPIVAAAGVAAYLTVDRHPKLGLSRSLANILAGASVSLVFLEYYSNQTLILLALAHWLTYLQLVKLFLPKTSEDDWFLFLLGLMQVLVGSVISQSDHVGTMLFSWAILALWVLALFSLHRDATRDRESRSEVLAIAEEPYPGLLDWPFLISAFRVTGLTMALGGVIFLAMPRRTNAARTRGNEPIPKHLTGFDDEVKLGQLGEILENDTVVMSVELYDEKDRRIEPKAEMLWRGVTMSLYERGRWGRVRRKLVDFPIMARKGTIRQQIKLEANDSTVLFGLRPMLSASATSSRSEPELCSDGTLARADTRLGTYDYKVDSSLDPNQPQTGEWRQSKKRLQDSYLGVPDTLRPRLQAIAERVVKDIPSDDLTARVRALETYLRDSGQFSYTLRMEVKDPKLDPVEDFLINRKEGHCEYFASALALLLRSIDIPTRMVNGFKGGDWNGIAQVLSVRQKHAHSWVEAYLGEGPDDSPIWLTLDPTPVMERKISLDRVGGFSSNFRQVSDLIRYVWVFYIVGFNEDRQKRLIYEPIRELSHEARNGFAMMGQATQTALGNLLHFRDIESFISIRGFFVSFVGLLLLVGLFRGGAWVVRRCVRWARGANSRDAALSPGVAFYRRLTQLLAEFGLDRPPAETQNEFARRAAVFLTGKGSSTESVADVPGQVVDAFYRVRFGHSELPPGMLKHLEGQLDSLEACLRTTRS